jgi:hypothetical protein
MVSAPAEAVGIDRRRGIGSLRGCEYTSTANSYEGSDDRLVYGVPRGRFSLLQLLTELGYIFQACGGKGCRQDSFYEICYSSRANRAGEVRRFPAFFQIESRYPASAMVEHCSKQGPEYWANTVLVY